jgi:hypothetical protein
VAAIALSRIAVLRLRNDVDGLADLLEELGAGNLAAEDPYVDLPNEIGTLARAAEVLRGKAIAARDAEQASKREAAAARERMQKEVLGEVVRAAQAARATGLPVIVHTRDADEDTVAILSEEMEKGGFVQCHCRKTGLVECQPVDRKNWFGRMPTC